MSRETAVDLARRVRRGELSAVSLARQSLATIDALDGASNARGSGLGALLTVDAEGALAAASTVDRALARARDEGVTERALEARYPLAGLVVGVKDAFCTRGLRTTCGSKMLERYVPPYDAHAVSRLREAGAVIVGKCNMDEFAMGSSTENSAYFAAKNPWDPSRVPGGSSGGSAVAVAASLCHVALGSDTGGSVRQPAALTGVVGFKPSYGRISRYGLVAFASSLDVVGPIASCVRDAELVYAALAGRDRRDATSLDRPVERADFSRSDRALAGARIGVAREYFDAVSAEVRATVLAALEACERAGAVLVELSMPHTRYALAAYCVLAAAECSANLARFDGIRFGASRATGFGREVARRILLGTYVLSAGHKEQHYERALRARTLVARDFDRAFEGDARVDVIATPTTPTVAWSLGDRIADPLAMYESDICTLPASLAGVPAISVRCGVVREQDRPLPVGLQLAGPRFADARLLEIALAIEQNLAEFVG
ncbi:MAG: Asp-tRNA(Asn)/Glu-tRNA(Gln) amidotransferase subunit GatA [Myxococcales bacterium]|nr:Asp-tRNA(Asn)/Glu-tRNA(Gln) amidotransferase subunit GatA [Myxococcales bacterium]